MTQESVPFVIALDNGVSAYYTVLDENSKLIEHAHVPVKKCRNYTKEEQRITRIDVPLLVKMFSKYLLKEPKVLLERPMINNTRFKQSMSAIRAFEATLIALEQVGLEHQVVDSKSWQRTFLPGGTASDQLKETANKI